MLDSPETYYKKIDELSGQINELLLPDAVIAATFSNPYVRLDPAYLPVANPATTYELVTLPGEYQAIGLDLTNCTKRALSANVSLTGIDAKRFDCQVRKQIFLETWYEREKNRFADALPLLPRDAGGWQLEIPKGGTEKLYFGFHVPKDIKAGQIEATVSVDILTGQSHSFPVTLNVVAKPVPGEKRFGYLACTYPWSNAAGKFPELTAIDLAEHGATMMELPTLPDVKFTENGEIASVDFSNVMAQVRAYAPHIKMAIFWELGSSGDDMNSLRRS